MVFKMKKVSDKQHKVHKELKKVYDEISDERGHYCTGCGRSDLITDKDNITYHCLSIGNRKGCHDIWDSGDRHKLLDYHKNIEYILSVDTEYYFLIVD